MSVNLFAQPLSNAMKLLEMKQYNQAKSAFLNNIDEKTTASDWFNLGKIYNMQNQADSAKICFSKITFADPKSALSFVAQAINELSTGNNSQALITLEKAQKMAVSGKNVNALVEIAPVRYQTGDTAGWIIPLRLASEIEPKNPKPYTVAGEIYQSLGERFKKQHHFVGLASGRYEQALYYAPDNFEARTGQAEIFVLGGNYTEAALYLDHVISKDSNYIPALKVYGELTYALGNYNKASLFYSRYMALSEFSDKDLSRFITILYFNKEYAKANELINRVLVKEPSNAVMLRLKGYTSFELGKYSEGLDAMQKFFDLRASADTNKIIATDFEYAGKLFSRNGNDSVSIIYLKKAMEMDSSKNGLYEDISKSYEKQKKYLLAVDYYFKYIEARKGNVASAIYFNIGKDLLVLSNDVANSPDSIYRTSYLQRADTAFRKVIELSPNSHLGYQWHARVAAALDPETLLGLAKPDYEKTLSIIQQKTDLSKYTSDLIEGYRYLGYYYYLQFETAKTTKDDSVKEQAKTLSINFWQKVLDLDAENDVAKQAIKALK
jgi:tetratricopeptide (TPR) repeat protein